MMLALGGLKRCVYNIISIGEPVKGTRVGIVGDIWASVSSAGETLGEGQENKTKAAGSSIGRASGACFQGEQAAVWESSHPADE